MTIEKVTEQNKTTLLLEGWLDTITSPELGEAVDTVGETEEIVLDFDKLEYISSAGLRQVVACKKKADFLGAAFSVVNVGKEVYSIFSLTGLDKKIRILGK